MHTPNDAISATRSYLYICSLGTVFIVGYNAVSAILRGLGDSKTPLLFVAIAWCNKCYCRFYFGRWLSNGSSRSCYCNGISTSRSFYFFH